MSAQFESVRSPVAAAMVIKDRFMVGWWLMVLFNLVRGRGFSRGENQAIKSVSFVHIDARIIAR
jgi:hypothetical protein